MYATLERLCAITSQVNSSKQNVIAAGFCVQQLMLEEAFSVSTSSHSRCFFSLPLIIPNGSIATLLAALRRTCDARSLLEAFDAIQNLYAELPPRMIIYSVNILALLSVEYAVPGAGLCTRA
uniref:Uncharacterized protein n=1 Tax=Physcomitrium patens TaxID=3218 RepID=A0A2K1J8N5_PHYPA|nr:hypothetical protein PHYPA_020996 [Physcomitrium patens]